MGALAWLMNLGFALGVGTPSGIVTERLTLVGTQEGRLDLLGVSVTRLSLVGTEAARVSIESS